MYKTFISISTFLLLLIGCKQKDKSIQDDDTSPLISVDLTTAYPEKDFVIQDLFDVEYIPLETTDEFVTRGIVKAISNNYVLTGNQKNDGNLYLFNRATGKGIRVINRKGQGGEEYLQPSLCLLDETKEELFIADYPNRKLFVYDLYGNYKRDFKFNTNGYYDDLLCFNEELLLVRTKFTREEEHNRFLLISKQDGRIIREIQISSQIDQTVMIKEHSTGEDAAVYIPDFIQILQTPQGWEFVNMSSDTLYRNLSGKETIIPTVIRTPSISETKEHIYLFPKAITNRYYLMQTVAIQSSENRSNTDLVYDNTDHSISRYTLYNRDFTHKKVSLSGLHVNNASNYPIVAYPTLEAPDLVEAYQAGKLQGRLKEIAAKLDEEDNAVIMLVKYKEN